MTRSIPQFAQSIPPFGWRLVFTGLLIAASWVPTSVVGENVAIIANRKSTAKSNATPVRLTFEATPLLRRIEGRPGQLISLQWTITSKNQPIRLGLQTVAIRQHPNGAFQPIIDASEEASLMVRGPKTVLLGANKSRRITAKWRLPNDASQFASIGLLVTDESMGPAEHAIRKNAPSRAAGLRFVTRYMLRVDADIRQSIVRTDGIVADRLQQPNQNANRWALRLTNQNPIGRVFDAAITPCDSDGQPINDAINLRTLRSRGSDRMVTDAIRMLPGGSLDLIGVPIRYKTNVAEQLKLQLDFGRRRRTVLWLPIKSSATADAITPSNAPQPWVTPTTVRLRSDAGGQRYLPIRLANPHNHRIDITSRWGRSVKTETQSRDFVPSPEDAVSMTTVRPSSIKLEAGRSRNMVLSIDRSRPLILPADAVLRFEMRSPDGIIIEHQDVPVSCIP